MSKKMRIIIVRSSDPDMIDCPRCGFAVRDLEDMNECRKSGMCSDCKMNPTKTKKDNN